MEKDFIEIGEAIINNEILDTKFTCDLEKCKGACCTMESEYGAPVTKEEIKKIKEVYPVVKKYLPKKHVSEIEKKGFWYEFHDEVMISSVNNRECVFVYYDGDVAKCGIEKAYRNGEIDFIKPISCHHFPIRISNFGGPVLRYEEYSECKPAIAKGHKTGLNIAQFCKDSLERAFGTEWYAKLKKYLGAAA